MHKFLDELETKMILEIEKSYKKLVGEVLKSLRSTLIQSFLKQSNEVISKLKYEIAGIRDTFETNNFESNNVKAKGCVNNHQIKSITEKDKYQPKYDDHEQFSINSNEILLQQKLLVEEDYNFFVFDENETSPSIFLNEVEETTNEEFISTEAKLDVYEQKFLTKTVVNNKTTFNRKLFRCDKCSFESKTEEQLTEHVTSFENKKLNLKCAECCYTTRSSTELIKHLSNVHMNSSYNYYDPDGS